MGDVACRRRRRLLLRRHRRSLLAVAVLMMTLVLPECGFSAGCGLQGSRKRSREGSSRSSDWSSRVGGSHHRGASSRRRRSSRRGVRSGAADVLTAVEEGAQLQRDGREDCYRMLFDSLDGLTEDDFLRILRTAKQMSFPVCEARDTQGMTLLHHAARRGSFKACLALLRDSDGRQSDTDDDAQSGGKETGKLDVNARDMTTGCTALHFACGSKYGKICSLLVEHGARIDMKDKFGVTPQHLGLLDILRKFPPRRISADSAGAEKLFMTDEELHTMELKRREMAAKERQRKRILAKAQALEKEFERRKNDEEKSRNLETERLHRIIAEAAAEKTREVWESYRRDQSEGPPSPETIIDFPEAFKRLDDLVKSMDHAWARFSKLCKEAQPYSLRFSDIPLPDGGKNSDSHREAKDVPEIIKILAIVNKNDRDRARVEIKKLYLRWHPDKFVRRFSGKIVRDEHDLTSRGVHNFAKLLSVIDERKKDVR